VKLALDDQIFAIQRHGGISRIFYELTAQFLREPSLGVEMVATNSRVVNDYVLADPAVAQALGARRAGSAAAAIVHLLVPRRRDTSADVVHRTFYLPTGPLRPQGRATVVTLYDMIPEVMHHSTRRLDFATRKRSFLKSADHIMCISQSALDDLHRIWPDIQVPASVAHLGVSPRFSPGTAREASLPEPYLLHVGNRAGYKDAATLTAAFGRIAGDHPDVTLLYVGGGAPTPAEREQWAAVAGRDRVQWIESSDASLPAVYAQALACVVPSRYEGFGLPALEGMASGSPQLLSRTSSLPEVGGDAAEYFSPGNVGELADLLDLLLRDAAMRAAMSRRGLERAGTFTWAAFAEQTRDAYLSALDS
jgi:glycosyltransferase involved in cell wall biosynthesis